MPARRTSRITAPALLTVALLALAGTGLVTDAAKCYPKPKDALTPTVTDAPVVEDLSPATQVPLVQSGDEGSAFPVSAYDGRTCSSIQFLRGNPDKRFVRAQNPTESSFESSEVSQGSSTQTQASGKCVMGNPNAGDVTREQVDWGKLSYCVRWDTDKKLEKAVATKFQAMLEKQINLWNRWLDKSIMDWTDDSLGTIYEGILDAEGIPKCPDECYKHLNQATAQTRPGEGAIGTGGDWGQRVEVDDMLNTMDGEEMMVLLHEMGHGFGLPRLETLTDGDGWLLRSVLEHIKSRYDF
ncbi:hypothetical protein GQ600_955 [Phytophthora cactorum]|nr:hypothetical protein GQ600_955 [Phytophthora cactorum]